MGITWLGGVALLWLLMMCIRGYRRGFIKEVVSMLFMVFALLIVWIINPYVSDFVREHTLVYGKVQEASLEMVQGVVEKTGTLQGNAQQTLVDQLPVPEFLKDRILEENTRENYLKLHADDFVEYAANYLAMIIANSITFAASFVMAVILLNMAAAVLNVIAKLPVLNGINRIIGACLGGIKGVVLVWILLLLLTLFVGTDTGKNGMKLVAEDSFLSFMYETDVFLRLVMHLFHGA